MSETARGYSKVIADAVRNANADSIGVRLGRICVDKQIPVMDVAEFFGVSRQAVYLWFKGESVPATTHRDKMQKLIEKLQQQ